MSQLAPIALFVFNRPWHTRRTIEALQKNPQASESELFVDVGDRGSGRGTAGAPSAGSELSGVVGVRVAESRADAFEGAGGPGTKNGLGRLARRASDALGLRDGAVGVAYVGVGVEPPQGHEIVDLVSQRAIIEARRVAADGGAGQQEDSGRPRSRALGEWASRSI